jgi:small subunit ribosomal protein S10
MVFKELKIKIQVKAFHPFYINRFLLLAKNVINENNFVIAKHSFLPQKKESFTVLRSPHVDKKARDQYERITHKQVLILTSSYENMQTIQELHRFISVLQGLKANVGLNIKFLFKN